MAEFCPDCWNKLNGWKLTEDDYVLSRDLELCEGCGKWKRVVVGRRKMGWLRRLLGKWRKNL